MALWKRTLLTSLVLVAVVLSMTAAPAYCGRSLGNLGKPADYDETKKNFKQNANLLSSAATVESLPASYNYKELGMVTPAKDQGYCGSCWAFAAVGVMESKLLIAGEGTYNLSEQQQVSCNTAQYGCDGGWSTALRFYETVGPMEESCTNYPSYGGADGTCSTLSGCTVLGYHTQNYYTVDTSDIDEMKMSLYEDGPAFFSFDVYSDFYNDNQFWDTYSPGAVYTAKSTAYYVGSHAVLLIGWDDTKQAWLLKNSWGATGGPNGDGTFWVAYSGHAKNLDFGMANTHLSSTMGSVTVTIGPSDAVSAGAQWQVDSGSWRNSGTSASVSPGSHTISFKTITGWTAPASQTVTVVAGENVSTTGTYTQSTDTGSLTVTISPWAAVSAGAMWRVDGGTWRTSGTTASGLSAGSHTVSFSTISGYTTPASRSVTISSGSTTSITGTYSSTTGSITVDISPSTAVSAGARWQINNGIWRTSGTTVSGLAAGTYKISFKSVSGWNTPATQYVAVSSGSSASVTGTYTRPFGAVKVTIGPSGAVAGGAQWRVDGGEWHGSGETVSGLSVGRHTITYSIVPGYYRPASKVVKVTNLRTTRITGTYVSNTGALRVTINPSAAVSSGAQWRVDGGVWHSSGYRLPNLAAGSHTVTLKGVSGWNIPSSRAIKIVRGKTTSSIITYRK